MCDGKKLACYADIWAPAGSDGLWQAPLGSGGLRRVPAGSGGISGRLWMFLSGMSLVEVVFFGEFAELSGEAVPDGGDVFESVPPGESCADFFGPGDLVEHP